MDFSDVFAPILYLVVVVVIAVSIFSFWVGYAVIDSKEVIQYECIKKDIVTGNCTEFRRL